MILILIVLCTLPAPKTLSQGENRDAFDLVIDAIVEVESGGDCDAVGDGGLAIGPCQIHRDYWTDATRLMGVDWPYTDARDPDKAKRAVRAYCEHYATCYRQSWTPEIIARIHNGGPVGWRKSATDGYWKKVRSAMDRHTTPTPPEIPAGNQRQRGPQPVPCGLDEDGFDRARSLRLRLAGQG